ncbi:MAG: phosphate--AMP phosphotransferase [Eubacterium sp.]|nr:phosphate--AMP phosphotransferase [Eubacterium sp.]
MLEQVDVDKKMTKEEYDKKMDSLSVKLGELQRKCREQKIPVMVIFDGVDAAGKGTMINRMIQFLDPRGYRVFSTGKANEEERMRPYFWRFFTKTPERGRMHIFDQSWYRGVYEGEISEKDAVEFEKMLIQDGTLIVKFFLLISAKEQKKRLENMEKDEDTRWRVCKQEKENNKNYDACLKRQDTMLVHTDIAECPWVIVEGTNKLYATCKIVSTLVSRMEEALSRTNNNSEELPQQEPAEDCFRNGVLHGIDLSKTMTKEEYQKEKKKLQKKLRSLHNQMYLKRLPVVLAFEGWDAGGKGGAIKRLTQAMDPRGYEVVPTASPNDIEKAHHYLWRFWEKFPKAGHMAIFDRTWYGRVLVERVEGFATEKEWKRAYREINDMEEQITNAGGILLKFWMHIDKDEQERRFHEREQIPEKQWKITEEDWRNRARWDDYEKAVDEMILRTSTENAPWIVVEGNSKYYARIKVLKTVVEALEKKLSEI